MTVEELATLTEQLLSGELTRPQVAEEADARLPGPYYPTPLAQEPKMQLELMLLKCATPAGPGAPEPWWFRDSDFVTALGVLRGSLDPKDIGDGWQQFWRWPEGQRFQWELTFEGDELQWLEARGVRLLRHVSDQTNGVRADLLAPSGQIIMVMWCSRPPEHEIRLVYVYGTGPAVPGVSEALGLLRVDLDNSYIGIWDTTKRSEVSLGNVLLEPHWVLRLDDNGNTFRVARFATKEAADAVAKRFEDLGHKQTYWSAPA